MNKLNTVISQFSMCYIYWKINTCNNKLWLKKIFLIKLILNPVVILIFVVYLFYLAYYSAWVPWWFRRRYKKYKNLKMTDKFYFKGDLKITNQNENAKKFKFQHFIDYSLSFPNTDIILVQIGTRFYFDLCSPKAFREFNLLVPDKIDRYDHKALWFGNFHFSYIN